MLLNPKIDVNVPDSHSNTALHISCKIGDIETIHLLLQAKNVQVNAQNANGDTPLHFGLEHKEIAFLLLRNKADPGSINKTGVKPLDTLQPFKQLEDYDPAGKYWKWKIDNPNALVLGPQIGAGRFGVVFEGDLYGTRCAVKQIVSNSGDVPLINHEIGIMGDIHHPNIVAFLGTCDKDGTQCIITEYIDGGCLCEYMSNYHQLNPTTRGLPFTQVLSMALDIARGMSWLHNHQPPILHRDLHSKNIMVTSQGVCKICDFGLSYVQGGVLSSTMIYKRLIPPELATLTRTRNDYTQACDIFMYGLVLYELITGEKGKSNNTDFHSLNRLKEEIPPEEISAVTPYMDLISQCLSETPEERGSFLQIIRTLNSIRPTNLKSSQTIFKVYVGEYVVM
uniref:Protein kinase domain-containing protein n=1 Tax=Arcella intermedia TaxID=1963864 RepID=A0A6B2L4X8_9EUKA